ncbi:hypothetical protein DFH11DRAFT_1574264 [Phellopilus nigrolimitatus]|nr:hypothetical protein DFH11DRAFT_1574264 [Phellopilus nigrolimitatus]
MSFARSGVKRTYGSQGGRPRFATTPYSSDASLSSSPTSETDSMLTKRKRPLTDHLSNVASQPTKKIALKRPITGEKPKTNARDKKKAGLLTQLHFSIDQSVLRTCSLCDLSYTRGAPDDESLHKVHCARVQKGMEWGREEEKERGRASGDVTVVEENVTLKRGEKGRIVAVKASAGGKIRNKVMAYLKTANLALSAPDMTPESLELSKVYLFLLCTPGNTREKIVGCVVAQQISGAMQVATQEEISALENPSSSLIHVEGNLYCKPGKLPTPMGVPRLFVSSVHRRKGVAEALLTAAAKTLIYGCELDPVKGDAAFSQPTSMGRTVMEKWGRGAVRIYEE